MVLQSELEILSLVDAGFYLFEESAKPNHVIHIISQTIISAGTSWAARVGQNIIALTLYFGSLLPSSDTTWMSDQMLHLTQRLRCEPLH
jgi:hypothetical protein